MKLNLRPAQLAKIFVKLIEAGWLLIIFLIPLYFNVWGINIFELDKIVLFRILVEIMLFLFVLRVFLEEKFVLPVKFKHLLPVLFFFFVLTLSTIFATHFDLSFWGDYKRGQGLFTQFHYFIFFLLVLFDLSGFKPIKRAIWAILFSASGVSLYALVQYLGFDFFEWPENIFLGRVISSLGQPNFLAVYLILVIPSTIYALRRLVQKFWPRFFIFLLLVLELLVLFLTLSRAAWLAGLTSLAIFFLIYIIRRRKKIFYFLIFLMLIIVLLIASIYFVNQDQPTLYSERLKSFSQWDQGSIKVRLIYYQIAADLYQTMPWWGYGLDALSGQTIQFYQPLWAVYEKINTGPDRLHNALLDWLMAAGVLGLLSYLILWFSIFYRGIKEWLSASDFLAPKRFLIGCLIFTFLAYFINNLFSFEVTLSAVYFWFYLALLLFLTKAGSQTYNLRLKFVSKILITFFLGALLVILIWFQNVNLGRADVYLRRAYEAEKNEQYQLMFENFSQAIHYNSRELVLRQKFVQAILNYSAQAPVELKAEMLKIAQENLKSFPQEQWSFWSWLLYAQVLNFLSVDDPVFFQEAEAAYLKLSAWSPQLALVYKQWGDLRLFNGDYNGAIEKYEQALSLYPSLDHPHLNQDHQRLIEQEMIQVLENSAQSWLALGELEKARTYYQEIIELRPLDSTWRKKISDTYYLEGNFSAALEAVFQGQRLNPTDTTWSAAAALLAEEMKSN